MVARFLVGVRTRMRDGRWASAARWTSRFAKSASPIRRLCRHEQWDELRKIERSFRSMRTTAGFVNSAAAERVHARLTEVMARSRPLYHSSYRKERRLDAEHRLSPAAWRRTGVGTAVRELRDRHRHLRVDLVHSGRGSKRSIANFLQLRSGGPACHRDRFPRAHVSVDEPTSGRGGG